MDGSHTSQEEHDEPARFPVAGAVLVVEEFSSEGSRTSRTQDGKGCPAAKVMPGPM
jgi:hypothetical protein